MGSNLTVDSGILNGNITGEMKVYTFYSSIHSESESLLKCIYHVQTIRHLQAGFLLVDTNVV